MPAAPPPRSIRRTPPAHLRAFVRTLWAFDSGGKPAAAHGGRERVLPTGEFHLVIRLSPAPLVLYDDESGAGARTVGTAVVGGARSRYYVRDVGAPSRSIGAQLRPGAAKLLFGVPASELAEAHTALVDLWGHGAERVRERLADAPSLARALDVFEAILGERLPRVRALHPAIAEALARFDDEPLVPIGDIVDHVGWSHRRFLELFRADVGLPPKQFLRVRRFQRCAELLASPSARLAPSAAEAGYSDQAHMSREFTTIAGVSPGSYRALAAPSLHVPIPVRGRP